MANDGLLRFKVVKCGPDFAQCEVVVDGKISNHKGANVPSVVLPLTALTDKDTVDLEFLCKIGVDWIALSFVQRPQDLEAARNLVAGRAKLLSKIEKPAALECLDEIIAASDAIMVARGDLGVELPVQKLPMIQKSIVAKSRESGRPVIVATQMLESMIESPVPTRAEVNDVANAFYDGADAIMLSAETAAGKYPVNAVKVMVDVAKEVYFRYQIDRNSQMETNPWQN